MTLFPAALPRCVLGCRFCNALPLAAAGRRNESTDVKYQEKNCHENKEHRAAENKQDVNLAGCRRERAAAWALPGVLACPMTSRVWGGGCSV